MGRKKKRNTRSEERIFCYYCERKFQNEQVLVTHQKEKHLRCPTCNKRLFSISGLVIHSSQVHNVQVHTVPNAIEGRTSTAVDVVGMKGIPPSYFHQPPAKAARTGLGPNGSATPVYDAPPPGAPAYPTYPSYPSAAPQNYYQPYGSAQHGGPAAYGGGYGNGYQNYYANGYHQQYPAHYQPYPGRPAQQVQPYNPTYPPAPQTATHPPAVQPATSAAGVPASTAQTKPAVTTLSSSGAAPEPLKSSAVQLSTSLAPVKAPPQVKVVFDSLDVSMEEMRAKLLRYKLA